MTDISKSNEQLINTNDYELNNLLPLGDSKINTSDYDVLLSILLAIAIAERETDKQNCIYWNDKSNLNKHRDIKDKDNHIQQILMHFLKIGSYNCEEYKCADNKYYRTKMECSQRGIVLFVMHTVDKKANYLQSFYQKNYAKESPKFFYIQYSFSNGKVLKISLNQPDSRGNVIKSLDLIDQYKKVKSILNKRESINSLVTDFKKYLSKKELKEEE